MKLSLLVLGALPLLVGGIAITTAVAVLGTADTPAPAAAPTQVLGKSVGDRAGRADTDTRTDSDVVDEPGDGSGAGIRAVDSLVGGAGSADRTGSGDDTEIDGRRPHLTVIDGHSEVALPGSVIHAAISALPPPSRDLPPLSELGGDQGWTPGGGARDGRSAPGAGGLDEPGSSGAPDDRPDPSALDEDPESLPPRKPGAAPPLGGVPELGSPTDDGPAGEDGSGARPPAPGRPGRPVSDLLDSRMPSDPIGHPGAEDSVGWPPVSEPEPLPPSTEPLVPGMELLVPDAVDPVDVEGTAPNEASRPTVEPGLDNSRPPIR